MLNTLTAKNKEVKSRSLSGKAKQKLKLILSNPMNLLYLLKDHRLKYFLITLPFLLVMNNKSNAQTQNMVWAREGMGTGIDQGNAITADPAGNVYTTGYFESTCDFDPGAGITNLTSAGKLDIFIMKSDASGNLIWVKSIGGTGNDEGKCIALDASGNVYVAGSFEATVDFDPGAGTVNLIQSTFNYEASFILKLNSTGNFIFVKQFGGASASVQINKIILDASANIIASGSVYGTQDFDPGAGTANITPMFEDAYLLKLTSAGNFVYVNQIRGINSSDYTETYGMSIDPSGNVVIAGKIDGSADFNPGAGTAIFTTTGINNEYFVAKYTSAGNYVWAGLIGGISTVYIEMSDLTTDASGNIYITSNCYGGGGTVDFDPTAAVTNINTGIQNIWFLKLTPNGNFVWAKSLRLSGYYWNLPIHSDNSNGLYIAGNFEGTSDFDPNAGVFNLTSTTPPYGFTNEDCYILKLDTAGNFIWAEKYGTRFDDWVGDMCLNTSGNTYTTGSYCGEGDFDPGPGIRTLYSNGATDIFIQKLNNSGVFSWANGFGGATYQTITNVSKNMGTFVSATGYFNGSTMFGEGGYGGYDIMINKPSGGGLDISYCMGGPGNDAGTGIISDASDNIYVTGYFEQTADFAPNPWNPHFALTSAGNKDIFILKINSSGKLVWAKRIGGTSDDESSAITLDNSGNLYVTGYYQGTVDFNPGAATNNLTSAGISNAFVLKLDTAGNYIWAKSIGGASADLGYDITVDGAGNVITSGSFNGTADFDPSAATFNLTSVGSVDAFIVKLNSSGNFVWAKSFGSSANEFARCIITDASNNVICAGSYGGTTDFDPNAGVTNLTPPNNLGEIFLLQLTSAGNFSWVKSMGGAGADKVTGLTRDAIGNIYTSGSFTGTADLNPSATTTFNVTSSGSNDVFINCYRPATDASWTKTIGGTSFDEAEGIAVDNAYNVYTIGNFGGTVDFDPNAGTFNLTAMGANDIFALKIGQSSPLPVELISFTAKAVDNKEVVCQWTTASEINNDYFTIERSQDAKIFEEEGRIEGAGNSTSVLNYTFTDEHPFTGISYCRLKQTDFNGSYSFSEIVAVTITNKNNSGFSVFPNPVKDNLNIKFNSDKKQEVQLQLYDVMGKKIFSDSFIFGEGINSGKVDVSHLSKGTYFIVVSSVEENSKFRIIKE